jgi:hypothetical protein
MNQPYSKRNLPFPLWVLMLLVSLGLHGLVLMMPIPSDPRKAQLPKQAKIKITQLPTFASPPSLKLSPQPSPQPASSPPQVSFQTQSPAPIRSIPPSARPTPKPISKPKSLSTPALKPTPTLTLTPSLPTPTPSTNTPTPTPPSSSSFDEVLTQVDQQGAFADFDSPELYFARPESFYDKSGKPLSGFDGKFTYIEGTNPEDVYKKFFANSRGFKVFSAEKYGGGLLYKVEQNISVRYVNLLPVKDGSGTIVIVWSRLPI